MKSKLFTALALCLCLGVLSGCSAFSLDDGELMRPPKTTGDEEKIIRLIEQNSGSSYTLKYPENGSNRSAIIMTDLDSDTKEEAIAFYQTVQGEDSITHMLIMTQNGDSWSLAGDAQFQNADIDRVELSDITGSGNLEIIAGVKLLNSNVKQLSVYSYGGGSSEPIDITQTYTSFVINDFDGDSKNDILALTLHTDSSDRQSEAVLLSYGAEEGISPVSSAELNQSVTGFESIASGKLNDEQAGAVLDGTIAGDKLCTQIIYYDSERKALVNGLSSGKTQELNPTIRDGKTYCADIDGNGIIEIPTLLKMPHGEEENPETVATGVVWNEFDSGTNTLAESGYMIVNYSQSYYFQLSKDFMDNTSARLNAEDNSMTIYEWNGESLQNPLLTIKAYNSGDWSTTGKNDGFSLIKQEGSRAFCYKISDTDGDYRFNDDDVLKSFILFSDYT